MCSLEADFEEEEIKRAVWSCGSNKAPGPDGANFLFIKSWNITGEEVIALIQNFHKKETLPKGINTTFIALIPKVKNVEEVSQFRPISLVNSLYKIIAKLLALRLKNVISPIVSHCSPDLLG